MIPSARYYTRNTLGHQMRGPYSLAYRAAKRVTGCSTFAAEYATHRANGWTAIDAYVVCRVCLG